MALIFLWHGQNQTEEETQRRFQAELKRIAAKAALVVKRDPCTSRTLSLGPLQAGIVDLDYGIRGYQPWCESDSCVALFSGVCESFLGKDPAMVADEMARLTRGHHRELARLEGRFSAVVLDKVQKTGCVVTGAIDASSLWRTDGPAGWALGSRAVPLLRMVERRPELDPVGAGLLLSFGYLWGTETLFQGVSRVRPRTIVHFDLHGLPRATTYRPLSSFLADCPALTFDESVSACAERIKERVSVQVAHSPRPLISLSGGVDSRSVTAALTGTGADVTAYASGSRTSREVTLATEAAGALGLPIIAPGLATGDVLAVNGSLAKCRAWSELSEGVECIRHVLSVPDLFIDGKPCLGDTLYQVFHGHGGNILHAPYYGRVWPGRIPQDERGTLARMVEVFRPAIPPHLHGRAAVEEAFEAILAHFADELAGLDLPLAQWFDLFYWQNRCLHWGSDMFAAKDLLGWHWAPLVDGELLRANVNVQCTPWAKFRFMERVVERLAPRAAACGYTGSVMSGAQRRLRHLKQLVPRRIRPQAAKAWAIARHRQRPPASPSLQAFWGEVFSQAEVLEGLVPRGQLMRLLETDPASPLLWHAATVALVAHCHLP